jgi:DNA-binding MarR family transcriptional regulator
MDRSAHLEEFFEALFGLHRLVRPRHEQFLKNYSLTGPQAELLYLLADISCMSIKDIASALSTTSSAATQLVESLSPHQFIDRHPGKDDRRYVEISLNEKALAFFRTFRVAHHAFLSDILEPLSDSELDSITSLRQKVITHLRKTYEK